MIVMVEKSDLDEVLTAVHRREVLREPLSEAESKVAADAAERLGRAQFEAAGACCSVSSDIAAIHGEPAFRVPRAPDGSTPVGGASVYGEPKTMEFRVTDQNGQDITSQVAIGVVEVPR